MEQNPALPSTELAKITSQARVSLEQITQCNREVSATIAKVKKGNVMTKHV